MSDFFTRLAARTLGLAPTLQPMIAPIFAQEQRQGETGLFEKLLEEEAPTRSGDGTRQGVQSEHERKQPQVSQSVYASLSEQSSALLSTTEERGKNTPIASQQVLQKLASMPIFSAPEPFHEESMPTVARETHVAHEIPVANSALHSQKESLMTSNTGEQHVQTVGSLPPIEHNEETSAVDVNYGVIEHRQTRHTTIITHQQDNETSFPMQRVADFAPVSLPLPANNVPEQGRRAMPSPINNSTVTNNGRTTGDVRKPFVPTMSNRVAAQKNVAMPVGQKQPEQPAPTIQVTIGRIEVRATPLSSSSATARQIPTPAVKSLDDYLRQREEGRVR